jgi:probable HAF family extracellular repeat protein
MISKLNISKSSVVLFGLGFILPILLVGGSGRSAQTIMIDIGTIGGRYSQANGINNRGQVVGYSTTRFPAFLDEITPWHAFVWENGKWTDLGTLGGPNSNSVAAGINDGGQVVGWYDFGDPVQTHAFLWQDGKMTDLGTLGGTVVQAYAINNRGQVVGTSTTANGYSHAFLWENGKMTDLGTLGGQTSAAGTINDQGQVVGTSNTADGTSHMFVWENGKMADRGVLPGWSISSVMGVNNRAQVVGYLFYRIGYVEGFLWDNGTLRTLGSLGGSWTMANKVNNRGQVVGNSAIAGGYQHAFLWEKGEMIDLGTLGTVGDEQSWAYAINESGDVVGAGDAADGRHAFVARVGRR